MKAQYTQALSLTFIEAIHSPLTYKYSNNANDNIMKQGRKSRHEVIK